jgi:ABC-2 type transport system permease protein
MNKTWGVFRKSLLEQLRSPWELSFVLLIGPFFVILYWLFFGGGSTSYPLLVLNQDLGPDGDRLIGAIAGLQYGNGQPLLKMIEVDSREAGDIRLRDREGAALVVIPAEFSSELEAFRSGQTAGGVPVTLVGDLTNPIYSVAAALTFGVLEDYLREATGQVRPVPIVEDALGGSAGRSEFELYVPGLLVVAVVMMLFTAAMRVTREVETGGLRRLALARVSALEFLAGVSAVQLLIGLLTVLLTFLAAWIFGFRSQGPLWVAVLVGTLTSFSVIGVGLIVAGFARTTLDAFIIANFPMILLMFFSGGVFPIQRVALFSVFGHSFALFDLLPQTHAVLALNKVLTLGSSFSQIGFEVGAMVVLSAVYFAAGVWIFEKRALRR